MPLTYERNEKGHFEVPYFQKRLLPVSCVTMQDAVSPRLIFKLPKILFVLSFKLNTVQNEKKINSEKAQLKFLG